jgi:hypothetical protein
MKRSFQEWIAELFDEPIGNGVRIVTRAFAFE